MVKVIGISGGSGAGKTTLAQKIVKAFGPQNCTLISQDSYYIDQSARFDKDGGAVNFDHPSSLDFKLMASHAHDLKNKKSIQVPMYDFATHKRLIQSIVLESHPIVILEGTLLLSQKVVRDQCDVKIFVQVPEEIRFSRRLKRDQEERGRTVDGVTAQFYNQVKPMHDEFVAPSMNFADIIVKNDDYEYCIRVLKQKLA